MMPLRLLRTMLLENHLPHLGIKLRRKWDYTQKAPVLLQRNTASSESGSDFMMSICCNVIWNGRMWRRVSTSSRYVSYSMIKSNKTSPPVSYFKGFCVCCPGYGRQWRATKHATLRRNFSERRSPMFSDGILILKQKLSFEIERIWHQNHALSH